MTKGRKRKPNKAMVRLRFVDISVEFERNAAARAMREPLTSVLQILGRDHVARLKP